MSTKLDTSAGSAAMREVAKVRHDLRNPLGHIMGFGELLLERARRQEVTSAIAALQELVSASERMLDEINHCLDPRRLGAGQAHPSSLQTRVEEFCGQVMVLGRKAETAMGGEAKVREDVARITDSATRMAVLAKELLPPLSEKVVVTPPAAASVDEVTPTRGARGGGDVIGLGLNPGDERTGLAQMFKEAGYQVEFLDPHKAGPAALARLPIDVLLIELALEEAANIRFLERLKELTITTRLPVMVLARSPSAEVVRQALQAGAQDVLRWPLPADLLLARMGTLIAVKRLHDQERVLLRRLAAEQERSEGLLAGLVPPPFLNRLRRGERGIAEHYPDASIVSADFGGLARWASPFPPETVVNGLSEVFKAYDALCRQHEAPLGRIHEDNYQVVLGIFDSSDDHMERAAELALAFQREALPLRLAGGRLLRARIGLHTGPLSAGVIGEERFSFECWGETLEIARVLRIHAPQGAILTSSSTAGLLRARYVFESAPSVGLAESKTLGTSLLLGKVP